MFSSLRVNVTGSESKVYSVDLINHKYVAEIIRALTRIKAIVEHQVVKLEIIVHIASCVYLLEEVQDLYPEIEYRLSLKGAHVEVHLESHAASGDYHIRQSARFF